MKTIIVIMAISAWALSAQCANAGKQCAPSSETAAKTTAKSETKALSLTIKELAAYNGKNGKPAYVAVDGVIYDVTGVEAWKDGEHKGGKAGTDISALIKNAPHKISVLGKRTTVGSIVPEGKRETKKAAH